MAVTVHRVVWRIKSAHSAVIPILHRVPHELLLRSHHFIILNSLFVLCRILDYCSFSPSTRSGCRVWRWFIIGVIVSIFGLRNIVHRYGNWSELTFLYPQYKWLRQQNIRMLYYIRFAIMKYFRCLHVYTIFKAAKFGLYHYEAVCIYRVRQSDKALQHPDDAPCKSTAFIYKFELELWTVTLYCHVY
jgi:hypothetical protein